MVLFDVYRRRFDCSTDGVSHDLFNNVWVQIMEGSELLARRHITLQRTRDVTYRNVYSRFI